MKVLHFFKTYLPDSFTGVERVIWNVAEGTASLGVETKVLALSASPPAAPVPVSSHMAYHAKQDLYLASTGLSLSVFKAFADLARDADLVHYHFPWPMMDLVDAVIRPECPTLVTYHSDIVKQARLLAFYKPLMTHFLNRVRHIVATSPNYADGSQVLRHYAAKTSVIPIGIEEQAPAVPPDVLHHWERRVGRDFFLFIGAPRYYKGLEFLIDAAKRTGLRVVIAGATSEEIESLAMEGTENIFAVGRVSDVDKEALLCLSRAFAFPSHLRSEAFGVALAEAARAGRPMISCELGTGTSFVNLDGETGLVVAPADAAAFGNAMIQLAADPALAARMGAAAQQRFVEFFGARRMSQAYYELYKKLVAGR